TDQHRALVFSGKDGSVLREVPLGTGSVVVQDSTITRNEVQVTNSAYVTSYRLPVINAGDVNGDGADDLAFPYTPSYMDPQEDHLLGNRLRPYDVKADAVLRDVSVSAITWQSYSDASTGVILTAGDLTADGFPEIVVGALELVAVPQVQDTAGDTSYMGSGSAEYSNSKMSSTGGGNQPCLAVVDVKAGKRLASLWGVSPQSAALFSTHEPGILGIAANGGVYFVDTANPLQVTSPSDGDHTGSHVDVSWQGAADGEFTQMSLDGVLSSIGYETRGSLLLTPG
ncbi:MAG: hypothetical protein NTU41_00265, partial [Chloroflexi bacterium]|nr:hypothetical protein [Chloroflexota bacterium]